MIRLAEILTESQPSPFWQMLPQLGVNEVVGILPRNTMDWRGVHIDNPWDYTPLAIYKDTVESFGLNLTAIEDNPPMDRLRYGLPGGDEELEQVKIFIENLGRLGISIWCYNWAASVGWIRTSMHLKGRGGATVSGYDHRVMQDSPPPRLGPIAREKLWYTLEHFLKQIIPVAERWNVKLAMHPDDPPVHDEIRSVGRIMNSVESFERLLDLAPSPMNGITLCQGNFTLMTDDLPSVIRSLGKTGKVFFVHFRDVMGDVNHFVETFLDEGKTDMYECIRAYKEVEFDGIMRSDHTPTLASDSASVAGYSTLGRLHAIGYIQGLMNAAYR